MGNVAKAVSDLEEEAEKASAQARELRRQIGNVESQWRTHLQEKEKENLTLLYVDDSPLYQQHASDALESITLPEGFTFSPVFLSKVDKPAELIASSPSVWGIISDLRHPGTEGPSLVDRVLYQNPLAVAVLYHGATPIGDKRYDLEIAKPIEGSPNVEQLQSLLQQVVMQMQRRNKNMHYLMANAHLIPQNLVGLAEEARRPHPTDPDHSFAPTSPYFAEKIEAAKRNASLPQGVPLPHLEGNLRKHVIRSLQYILSQTGLYIPQSSGGINTLS